MTKLLSVILLILSATLHAEQFQAPLTDTQWQVIESPLECSLSQTIEGFGSAKFIQNTGEDLRLVFSTRAQPAVAGTAYFEIAQAPWQNSEQRQILLSLPTENNQRQFILEGDLAKQALTHIQEGRFPTLRYKGQGSAEDISVLFSTIHLSDSMPSFEQCLQNLHPYSFEDVKKLTVYFSSEDSTLSDAAKSSLTRIANYVKIDDSIRRISIDGHTDNHGRKRLNVPLAEQRAIVIKNFFVEQCDVAENLITTSSYRELKPSQSNKTAQGRSHNRRAEIQLSR